MIQRGDYEAYGALGFLMFMCGMTTKDLLDDCRGMGIKCNIETVRSWLRGNPTPIRVWLRLQRMARWCDNHGGHHPEEDADILNMPDCVRDRRDSIQLMREYEFQAEAFEIAEEWRIEEGYFAGTREHPKRIRKPKRKLEPA